MKSRMSKNTLSSSLLQKQEFLNKWIKGLQTYSNSNKEMTILERKKAIKLSADVAIASTRNASTHWSRALIAQSANRALVEQILGRRVESNKTLMMIKCRSKKIVRRSKRKARRVINVQGTSVKACCIAKRLVKKRTLVLKRLVPGGEGIMDEICLIKETLDYIASLRVQVDVMRRIAAAAERLEHSRRLL